MINWGEINGWGTWYNGQNVQETSFSYLKKMIPIENYQLKTDKSHFQKYYLICFHDIFNKVKKHTVFVIFQNPEIGR